MNGIERLRDLVAAGENVYMGALYTRPPGDVEDEASLWEERTGSGIARSFTCAPSDLRRFDFFAKAANARQALSDVLALVDAVGVMYQKGTGNLAACAAVFDAYEGLTSADAQEVGE